MRLTKDIPPSVDTNTLISIPSIIVFKMHKKVVFAMLKKNDVPTEVRHFFRHRFIHFFFLFER